MGSFNIRNYYLLMASLCSAPLSIVYGDFLLLVTAYSYLLSITIMMGPLQVLDVTHIHENDDELKKLFFRNGMAFV